MLLLPLSLESSMRWHVYECVDSKHEYCFRTMLLFVLVTWKSAIVEKQLLTISSMYRCKLLPFAMQTNK